MSQIQLIVILCKKGFTGAELYPFIYVLPMRLQAVTAEANIFHRSYMTQKRKVFTTLPFTEMAYCPLVYVLWTKVRDSHIKLKKNS